MIYPVVAVWALMLHVARAEVFIEMPKSNQCVRLAFWVSTSGCWLGLPPDMGFDIKTRFRHINGSLRRRDRKKEQTQWMAGTKGKKNEWKSSWQNKKLQMNRIISDFPLKIEDLDHNLHFWNLMILIALSVSLKFTNNGWKFSLIFHNFFFYLFFYSKLKDNLRFCHRFSFHEHFDFIIQRSCFISKFQGSFPFSPANKKKWANCEIPPVIFMSYHDALSFYSSISLFVSVCVMCHEMVNRMGHVAAYLEKNQAPNERLRSNFSLNLLFSNYHFFFSLLLLFSVLEWLWVMCKYHVQRTTIVYSFLDSTDPNGDIPHS